ncbi:MAG: hypothetical protein Q8T09_04205 [Candidatus Melainabacteria bacterium]|nr:hypothetical protein [Candidatus Melainabacteria bacterium]
MAQPQHHFSRDDLTYLLNRSLRKWSNGEAKFECVTINCDEQGQVTGYMFMRPGASSDAFDKKSTTVTLSTELITTAIYQAASDEGSPLALNSLVFSNSKEAGATVVKATALAAAEESQTENNWPAAPLTAPGIVTFPAPVSVFFDNEELHELIKSSGKRAGYIFNDVSLTGNQPEAIGANLSVKTGNSEHSNGSAVTLSPPRLNQTLAAELTDRGYLVTEDGLTLELNPEPGNENKVCATVSVLAIPNP